MDTIQDKLGHRMIIAVSSSQQYGGWFFIFLDFLLEINWNNFEMRGKRSRTSSEASNSSSQPVKKLIKHSVTSEEDAKLARTKSTSASTTSNAATGNEVKNQSFEDVEKFRKASRTLQSLFEQMKELKGQNVEKTVSIFT